ncbi:GPI mannosyltransferase 1 [Boothiomyces sp. JEL0866]|nr:GPI mannosyltransferase 1 [Boothiomyces sp. JEL0866]
MNNLLMNPWDNETPVEEQPSLPSSSLNERGMIFSRSYSDDLPNLGSVTLSTDLAQDPWKSNENLVGGDEIFSASETLPPFPPKKDTGNVPQTQQQISYQIELKKLDQISVELEEKHVSLFGHLNYIVKSKSHASSVSRRYSDVLWLQNHLLKKYPFRIITSIPPKKAVGVQEDELASVPEIFETQLLNLKNSLKPQIDYICELIGIMERYAQRSMESASDYRKLAILLSTTKKGNNCFISGCTYCQNINEQCDAYSDGLEGVCNAHTDQAYTTSMQIVEDLKSYRDLLTGFQIMLTRREMAITSMASQNIARRITGNKNRLVEVTAKGGGQKEIDRITNLINQDEREQEYQIAHEFMSQESEDDFVELIKLKIAKKQKDFNSKKQEKLSQITLKIESKINEHKERYNLVFQDLEQRYQNLSVLVEQRNNLVLELMNVQGFMKKTKSKSENNSKNYRYHILFISIFLRLAFLVYGYYQDQHPIIKYTDIDYSVFTDAARYVADNQSPYLRKTFRYTPVLAWLLVPNVYFIYWGKILFCICDLIVGMILYDMAGLWSLFWLANPFVIVISTRGNAESVLLCLVFLVLYYLKRNIHLAAFFYGLSIHFKIYPIIYCIPLYFGLDNYISPSNLKLFSKRRIIFGFETLAWLLAFTGLFYWIYGYEFLYETLLYHVIRKDHRHNFSLYFYYMYLDTGTWSVITFLPQFLTVCGNYH